MKNLMESVDTGLLALGYPAISDCVNSKLKSSKYINNILRKVDNRVQIPFMNNRKQYDFRVKHVLFSFGLGILLAKFNNLDKKIEAACREYSFESTFGYIWLTLCIYHDYGYFCDISLQNAEDIEKIGVEYPIFNYNFCKSRYSRGLYRAYHRKKYEHQKWQHVQNDVSAHEEVGDHGILGGYILFDQLYSFEQKYYSLSKGSEANQEDNAIKATVEQSERIRFFQDICYRIMEHNIWKDYGDGPEFWEICGDNFKKIDISEPLLYLLSLVDTIEMTKKFCRYSDDGEEKKHFVYPKTLAQKVSIDVTENEIEINYGELRKFIQAKQYEDGISSWEKSVEGLGDWVQVNKSENTGDVITLNRSTSLKENSDILEDNCILSNV